ncbi:hypothetical protein [Halioxenophilus aromaticivorans]|uniref:MFS transporter n=1 Tax=Halioxenophilus aromaticivorans TaxID=1306992 RepID=A0AAV3U8X2_9ALTE
MQSNSASGQRWMMLVLVMAATFSPSVLDWMLDPKGAWFRPFLVWLVVIAIALGVQLKGRKHDDL